MYMSAMIQRKYDPGTCLSEWDGRREVDASMRAGSPSLRKEGNPDRRPALPIPSPRSKSGGARNRPVPSFTHHLAAEKGGVALSVGDQAQVVPTVAAAASNGKRQKRRGSGVAHGRCLPLSSVPRLADA